MAISVPVFMYHHVLPEDGFLAISVQNFERQMKFLAEKGYHTLSADEFLAFKKGEYKPPKKSILLTFDDGWRDLYFYAYPIMKKYGLKGTIFLVTSWVERASIKKAEFFPYFHKECKALVRKAPEKVVLNWEEVEKMQDVFDFHSHTHTHFEDKICIKEEFELSREILKERLGIESRHLCWPRGHYDEKLFSLGKACGYEIFYTTERGTNTPDGRLERIKRIAVKPGLFWFKKALFIYSHKAIANVYLKFRKN